MLDPNSPTSVAPTMQVAPILPEQGMIASASPSSVSPSLSAGLIYVLLREPEGRIVFQSIGSGCQEILQVEATELREIPDRLLELIDPDDRLGFQESLAQATKLYRPWQWEGRHCLPSGQVKWLQYSAEPEVQADGSTLWLGLVVDVTSQRRLNAEVQQLSFLLGLTERLQASTELREIARFALEYLVEVTDCAFGDVKVVFQQEGESRAFPLVNKISGQFMATYGEPVATEMEAVLQQGQPYGQGLLWDVIASGQPLFVEDYANHPKAVPALRHPGIGQLGIFPIPATDGTIIGVLTLESRNLQKIAALPQQEMILAACRILGVRIERAQAQERLQQKTTELEQTLQELRQTQFQLVQTEKMSSLGQLVAGVAHEINNPISFIHGNLHYANQYIQDLLQIVGVYELAYPQPAATVQAELENVDLDFIRRDLPHLLKSMRTGAERIRDIVLSLRNFSRLDEAEMKPVDIHEGLDSTLIILGNRLKAIGSIPEIKILRDYGTLPQVECYAGQLNQVFMNLLSNALDALEEHCLQNLGAGLEPEIQIRTRLVDERVRIQIADNGPGIPEAIQKRLFDPFFTTKPVGKGTGLGLSISYQIAQKHQGQLSCQSTVGQGTVFTIEIPVQHERPMVG